MDWFRVSNGLCPPRVTQNIYGSLVSRQILFLPPTRGLACGYAELPQWFHNTDFPIPHRGGCLQAPHSQGSSEQSFRVLFVSPKRYTLHVRCRKCVSCICIYILNRNTRQSVYVYHNIEELSRNHCSRGK